MDKLNKMRMAAGLLCVMLAGLLLTGCGSTGAAQGTSGGETGTSGGTAGAEPGTDGSTAGAEQSTDGGTAGAEQSTDSGTNGGESGVDGSAAGTEQEPKQEEYPITMKDISSAELVSGMKIGWNLGNTLDATGGIGIQSETAWGNPRTTEEMIDAVLEQGFNVIRIPVTWTGHVWGTEDYMIQEAWLDRVQQVVDYAYDKGAYVIINMHHEDFLFPSEEKKEAASKELKALWTQIATRFRDYDERLIFEGMNEPRKVGTNVEWNGGDAEGREVVNAYAEVFVEAVRATGGNNTIRHLMIPGYAASSSKEALEAIKLPDDDKLIVSVHAYTPYNFALNKKGTAEWKNDTKDIDYMMTLLDDLFISKGIPVIIGEFGAMNKENEAERVAWATYYVTKAKEIGVPCIWWDNNAFHGDGENFGLLDRANLTFPYPDLTEAIVTAAEK